MDDDAQSLRTCLRDVIGFTALPALWLEADAPGIANDLADALFHTLQLDALLVLMRRLPDACVARVRNPADADFMLRVRRAFETSRAGASTLALEPNGMQLALHDLSVRQREDVVIAGSYRADFPNEREEFLLQVAANEALCWLVRRDAEDALAAESRFREAIEDSVLAGLAAVDADGRQTYVNRALTDMVGWNAEELIGAQPPFVYWSAGNAELSELRSPAEVTFRRRNGERFDALILRSPLRDRRGRPHGQVMSVYDISERKRAERAAQFLAEAGEIMVGSRDERELMQALSALVTRRLADACFVDVRETDGGLRCIAATPAAIALEVLAAARDDDRERLRSRGITATFAVPLTSRGLQYGAIRLLSTSAASFDAALLQELGRRASLSIENMRLYDEARDANRAKDDFIALVSHELKTPMAAILGWIALLAEGMSEEDARDAVQTIEESAKAQSRIIDELLDVSRSATGKLAIEPASCSLGDIVANAVNIARPAASNKRQHIDVEILAANLMLHADAARLQQVFWNLLANAVKFTPDKGAIRVVVNRAAAMTASVAVSDSGQGIAPDLLPYVFERFRQGDGATRRGGLGLGLSIAREIVELHGGRIEAESDGERRGATFVVTLPLPADHA